MGRFIELRTWKRRRHYELFRRYKRPFFSTTVEVDVTKVWNECRNTAGSPFFLASLFFMLTAANETEAFRLRLRKRGVWLHDRVVVGSTILRADDTFGFMRLELTGSLQQFIHKGKPALTKATSEDSWQPMKQTDDIVFHTVLPWLRFTSFTNALSGDDSIPRVAFGQCVKVGRKVVMPVAVEVHHALVDGIDVAHFIERFAARCNRD